MKAYIIVQQGYEYNDEGYDIGPEPGVEKTASLSREEAQDTCDRLNGKLLRENPELVDSDYGRAIAPYKVVEVEIPSQ